MKPTATTASVEHDTPQVSRVVEEALDAFWDVVIDHFPLAKSGDLSPETTLALDAAANNAVEEWVKTNAPTVRRNMGLRPAWCSCDGGLPMHTIYMPDNACPCGEAKHHYHCPNCQGVVQIG